MNTYRKHSGYGPGGRNCTCCGPAPRHRKKFDRSVKRRERARTARQVMNEYGVSLTNA